MTWLPIDEVPEEWKDGREVLLFANGVLHPFVGHNYLGKWLISDDMLNDDTRYGPSFRQEDVTHAALIAPPEGTK